MSCFCGSDETSEEAEMRRKLDAEKSVNKELDRMMKRDSRQNRKLVKLLLLGAGESGKSTLFKQMTIIHGKGFSEEVRRERASVIHRNILVCAKKLIAATVEFKDHEEVEGDLTIKTPEGLQAVAVLSAAAESDSVDQKIADAVGMLLQEPAIQLVYKHQNLFQWPTSGMYFLRRARIVCQPGYIPSVEDVLKSRVRTQGIVEKDFNVDGLDFKIFDVGGQRNERKKWIHCFDDVTAVIFVAAISEYDQVLLEDRDSNRMDEALLLFEEICRCKWFKDTSIILFLNKKDVFEEKVKTVPISKWHKMSKLKNVEPYAGPPGSYRKGCEYWMKLFKSRSKRTGRKASALNQVYGHVTCATDTNNIRHVMRSVQDIVIARSLIEDGVL